MDDKKVIRDRETGEELSLEEIKIEYAIMKATDATEAETFEDYLSMSTLSKILTESNSKMIIPRHSKVSLMIRKILQFHLSGILSPW